MSEKKRPTDEEIKARVIDDIGIDRWNRLLPEQQIEVMKRVSEELYPTSDLAGDAVETAFSVGGKTLDFAGRALDYTDGNARNLAVRALFPKLAREGDNERALKGQYPDYSELLNRAGIDSPWLGFGLDIVANPTTWLGGVGLPAKIGAKALKLGKAGKYLSPLAKTVAEFGVGNPIGALAEAGGRSMYRGGVKKADEVGRMLEKGDHGVSETLEKYGIRGSSNDMYDQMQNQIDSLMGKRDAILEKVSNSGFGIVTDPMIAKKPAQEYIAKQSRSSQLSKVAKDMNNFLGEHFTYPMSPTRANLEKVVSSKTAKEASRALEANSSYYDDFHKAVASGLRDATDDAVSRYDDYQKGISATAEQAKKGLDVELPDGDLLAKLQEYNKDAGNLLTAKGAMLNEGNKEWRKNLFTSVDGMIVGLPKGLDAKMLAMKKLADLSKLSWFRTKGGYRLIKTGKNKYTGQLLDQGAIEAYRAANPWTLMDRKDDEQ